MKKRQVMTGLLTAAVAAGVLSGAIPEAKAEEDVVTLKWVTVGNGRPSNYEAWLDQINPYLEEKIGVNVDIEVVPWGDWASRRSILINSGEYFDLLFTNIVTFNAEVEAGALLDLTDLLPSASPTLYGLFDQVYWDAVSINGSIYGVPYEGSNAEFFIWDNAVAEKYGIDISTVTDFASLYDALSIIHEGEGGSQYHMGSSGADFLTSYYDQLGAGLPCLGVRYDDESCTVVNPLATEEILSDLDYVYKMYEDGIINGDAPTSDDTNSYRVFGVASGWAGAAETIWGPNMGIEDCQAIQFGDAVLISSTVRGSINAVYSGCEHPDKALQLLEVVNTDSYVRDLLYYGEEGVNWEYTEDHLVQKLDADWGMAGYTQGTTSILTQLAGTKSNSQEEIDALNASAVTSVMMGFDMDITGLESEIANCSAVYEKYQSEFFTGAQNPRELIDTIVSELDAAGWETIRESAQEQVDAWLAEQE